MRLTLEHTSNVALIVTCVLTSAVLGARYVRHAPTPRDLSQLVPFSVGHEMKDVADISYEQSAATLVLFAKSTCPYCSSSMPFYRQLVDLPAVKAKEARLVVASVEPEATVRAYLQQYGIIPDKVTSSAATRPTPTLVLVDRRGTIRGMWIGQQKPEGERDVVDHLKTLTAQRGS
jgi:thiol-disulfide isomerase/thioredoxin